MNIVHPRSDVRIGRNRRLKLRCKETLQSSRFHSGKLRIVGTKGALFEEAHCSSLVDDRDGHRLGRGWRAIGHWIDNRQIEDAGRCLCGSRCRQMRRIHERSRELRRAEQNLAAADEFTSNHADRKPCIGCQCGRIDKTDKRDWICQRHVSRLIRTGVRRARGGNKYFVLRRHLSRGRIKSSGRDSPVRRVTAGCSIHRPSHRLVQRAIDSGVELLGIAGAYRDRSWRYVDGDLLWRRASATTSANKPHDHGERKRQTATRHESPLLVASGDRKGESIRSGDALPGKQYRRMIQPAASIKLAVPRLGRGQESSFPSETLALSRNRHSGIVNVNQSPAV